MKIEKKIWAEFFDDVLTGKKKFEVRLADFECRPGDVLVLREWNQREKQYTGRVLEKKITFVLKTKDLKFWTEKEMEKHGLQVISF
jgi:ribosomal protein S17